MGWGRAGRSELIARSEEIHHRVSKGLPCDRGGGGADEISLQITSQVEGGRGTGEGYSSLGGRELVLCIMFTLFCFCFFFSPPLTYLREEMARSHFITGEAARLRGGTDAANAETAPQR